MNQSRLGELSVGPHLVLKICLSLLSGDRRLCLSLRRKPHDNAGNLLHTEQNLTQSGKRSDLDDNDLQHGVCWRRLRSHRRKRRRRHRRRRRLQSDRRNSLFNWQSWQSGEPWAYLFLHEVQFSQMGGSLSCRWRTVQRWCPAVIFSIKNNLPIIMGHFSCGIRAAISIMWCYHGAGLRVAPDAEVFRSLKLSYDFLSAYYFNTILGKYPRRNSIEGVNNYNLSKMLIEIDRSAGISQEVLRECFFG